jgi:1-aminocyclopropane-1-carboxylate deaminase/D-cysteine desulfhydrase-like pyridoxal-dependent ACC family enzyme
MSIARYNSETIERILELPRVTLGTWPTRLDDFQHRTLGRCLIKRDDLSGFGPDGRSGVKARKLEGLLGYAQRHGIQSFTIALGNITNLGLDLVEAAHKLQIEVNLLIVDDPPLPQARREEIFAAIRDRVRFLTASYTAAGLRLLLAASVHWTSKPRALVLAPSPAHPAAVLGMAHGYIEAMSQCMEQIGTLPRAVYIAAAAGISAAGLVLGESIMRAAGAPAVRVMAVKVVPQPLALWLPWLVRWTVWHQRLSFAPDFGSVAVINNPRHARYGRFDSQHEEICRRVADEFGIAIDPIYGGKSWSAFEELELQSRCDQRPPLFWHCGYTRNWESFRLSPSGNV